MAPTADAAGWRALFDPFSPDLLGAPHHVYRRLREADPVHWSPPLKAWVLTRLDDVRAVLEDPDFEALETSSVLREIGRRAGRRFDATIRFLDNTLFFTSGEAHRQARRTVVQVMNRVPLSRLEPVLVALADGLMDGLPSEGTFDVVAAFAEPFPQMVMAHILDIPQGDVPRLAAALAEATRVFDAADLKALDGIERGMAEAMDLVAARIADARDDSGLGMIRAGSRTVEDAAALALFLYRVGSETTIGMAALAFRTLMDRPDVAERLREEPSLVPLFVSEVLRLDSSVQRSVRVGRADKRIGGRNIRAGERVMLLIGAANRDAAGFADPDALLLERRPPDLAFGAGTHACVGIALSRLEGRVAVERFLARMPAVRAGAEEWFVGRTIRRLTKLPVQALGVTR